MQTDVHGYYASIDHEILLGLKQHPDRTGFAMERRSGGWNDDYLMQVLTESARLCALALGRTASRADRRRRRSWV